MANSTAMPCPLRLPRNRPTVSWRRKRPRRKVECRSGRRCLAWQRVGLTDNFFDLGGHSLLGLRLVNQLREALGEHVALALVFEAPTVARMADLLEENFPAAVARWIGSAARSDAGSTGDQTASASRLSCCRRSGQPGVSPRAPPRDMSSANQALAPTPIAPDIDRRNATRLQRTQAERLCFLRDSGAAAFLVARSTATGRQSSA